VEDEPDAKCLIQKAELPAHGVSAFFIGERRSKMRKLLISTVVISLFSLFITPQVFAECECDLNGDGTCDGLDWLMFYPDWGRTDCPDRPAAPLPITGQTTSYDTGDDGDLEMGMPWPTPRFEDNGDGTVTDYLTGVIWLKNAYCFLLKNWAGALTSSNSLADGQCGLSDGSVSGDWRLPNIRELQSLIDYGNWDLALPSGHPFTGVKSSYYWSSTTFASSSDSAWHVHMGDGHTEPNRKDNSLYVWPVRGGN
jgi:hypothetical protein